MKHATDLPAISARVAAIGWRSDHVEFALGAA